MADTPNAELLATVASIVAAAGLASLFFRVPREIEMMERNKPARIAGSDWLAIGATLVAILFALLPLLFFHTSELLGRRVPTAACAASLAALGGYLFAYPAHYGLLFGIRRLGKKTEPFEGAIIGVSTVLALALFGASLLSTA